MNKYKAQVLIGLLWFTLAVGVALLAVPTASYFDYFGGTRFYRYDGMIFLLSVVLGVCLGILFLCSVLSVSGRVAGGVRALLCILALLVAGLPFACLFFWSKPMQPRFVSGMIARLDKDVKPQEVRKWTAAIVHFTANPATQYHHAEAGETTLPASLTTLSKYPPDIEINILADYVDGPH